MKWHQTKEQAFTASGLHDSQRAAFYKGWYAAGHAINEGEDSAWLSERLKADDFMDT
jgi:hypothetical protein